MKNFEKLLQKLNINPTNNMLEKFSIYYKELVEKNKQFNLTAITEEEDVYVKHFLDSVLAVNLIKKDAKLCDIGAGAGFPGLPLKIVREDINLTMVDSLNKRITFLNNLTSKLSLKNTKSLHFRAEEYAKTENRESFDVVVSRAVANLATLSEYCLPFLKIGGKFLAYKGIKAKEEIDLAKNAIEKLGGKLVKIHKIKLIGTDIDRYIVEIEKISATNLKYPRGGNKPKNKPIC